MKRLNADVGSLQSALQKRPEVFNSVRMNLAVNVFLGVVDHLMDLLVVQAAVGNPCITENLGATGFRGLGSISG
jgi:hypothetical protein